MTATLGNVKLQTHATCYTGLNAQYNYKHYIYKIIYYINF